jgi:uncharacterized membrane protein YozB (DUF420 family)
MDLSFLPAVNASLNLASTVLLASGLTLIKRGRAEAHRRVMISAFAVSSLFLACYLLHKASRGFQNTAFHGEGWSRTLYLVLLATHVSLAMLVPVLAIALIRLATRKRLNAHRRLARIAWPIWMYVSVTGVVIYVVLYHLNPAVG